MERLIDLDKEIFLALNRLHADWLDPVMYYLSESYTSIPLYLFLLYLLLKNFKNDSWALVLGIFITYLLANHITSDLMKPFFMRYRPSHEPSLNGLVHHVYNYKGGLYGFASSHAANTFGVATFFWMLWKEKYKWMILLFAWAFIVTYTRIYLGVHYPGDVLIGMTVGILAAFAGLKISRWLLTLRPKAD